VSVTSLFVTFYDLIHFTLADNGMYYAFFHYPIFGGYSEDGGEEEYQEPETVTEEDVDLLDSYEDSLYCDFSASGLRGAKVNIIKSLLHDWDDKEDKWHFYEYDFPSKVVEDFVVQSKEMKKL